VLPAFPYRFPVPRYGTFRNEKFFRILEGENAKTARMKNWTQVYQISKFKDSSSLSDFARTAAETGDLARIPPLFR